MGLRLISLRWHARHGRFQPLEVCLFDKRGLFDAERLVSTTDNPEHWTMTHHDQPYTGEFDVLIACIDASYGDADLPCVLALADRCRLKIAIVPEMAFVHRVEKVFDSILLSDDPLSWRAFLHLLTRDSSQLIGVDLVDQKNLWRGRIGRLFRRDYGSAVVAQFKHDLELCALDSPVSAVQLFFDGWSFGLGELDRVSTELLSSLGEIELVAMGAAAKGRNRNPTVELITFSDRASRRIF